MWGKICKDTAVLTTNTSSLSTTEISQELEKPVIGMHFFNLTPVIKLVEVNENAGFVVNRILIPMINEAIGIYASCMASVEDINTAMKLSTNYPMGLLRWAV